LTQVPLAGANRRRDHGSVAENRDQVALSARFDPERAEPILRVAKSDALDQSGQYVGRRAGPRCLGHRLMMQIDARTRYSVDQSNRRFHASAR